MKEIKGNWGSILRVEAFGFLTIIAISWLAEVSRLPHYVFGDQFEPNWRRALLRTFVLGAIWAWVHLMTRRLIRRLQYLEGFLRVCAWCRRICHDDKWMTMEQYFDSKFAMRTTHGVCPDCRRIETQELDQGANQAGTALGSMNE